MILKENVVKTLWKCAQSPDRGAAYLTEMTGLLCCLEVQGGGVQVAGGGVQDRWGQGTSGDGFGDETIYGLY